MQVGAGESRPVDLPAQHASLAAQLRRNVSPVPRRALDRTHQRAGIPAGPAVSACALTAAVVIRAAMRPFV
ncbi:hypothetical protein GCM10023335_87950 [Streptomyces siamensis]|uniref:Uncharacterized protein n=1 Tax=Streptomyces siamensis TaxID=1274986 RepID=A0ABP9JRW0_9ACTN